jgi:ABC-2 type transport system permease protein
MALNVMLTMEYRVSFLIIMLNTVTGPTVALLVWLTLQETLQAAGAGLPLDRGQLVTYFVSMGLVSMATSTWAAVYLAEDIRNGTLSAWLVRPAPEVLQRVGNNLGEKVVKLGLLLPLVGAVAVVFRGDLRLPATPLPWILFGVALVLAAVLNFLLDYCLGSLAFWLQNVDAAVSLDGLLRGLLAGRFIPLVFFPAGLQGFLAVQPWRFTLSFPLEVLTGGLPAEALATGFLWQTGYVVAAGVGLRLLWRLGLRGYAATGG